MCFYLQLHDRYHWSEWYYWQKWFHRKASREIRCNNAPYVSPVSLRCGTPSQAILSSYLRMFHPFLTIFGMAWFLICLKTWLCWNKWCTIKIFWSYDQECRNIHSKYGVFTIPNMGWNSKRYGAIFQALFPCAWLKNKWQVTGLSSTSIVEYLLQSKFAECIYDGKQEFVQWGKLEHTNTILKIHQTFMCTNILASFYMIGDTSSFFLAPWQS